MKIADRLELEDFLRKNNLKPSRALGQNFLVDSEVLAKIVATGELKNSDEVVEIGAGLGALTRELSTRVKKVSALEFDRNIFPALQENLKKYKNIELKNIDVRKFTLPSSNYKLVANIPYYLTSPILRKFFTESSNPPQLAVLLVQKEVAEKICDSKKLSVLALEVRIFARPEIVAIVKPESFLPPPKVNSAILKISLNKNPVIARADIPDFFKIVHAGFHSPRKKIRGSFASGLPFPKEVAHEILEKAEVDSNLRAEDLAISDWQKILTAFREFF
ncbi:ribosomal RNA small subunit methyltransferase A [Patescibacteria group bacterium]|nr:ribosomal RNA small subunit methyltransferase A [Patescibacteria group bacterium]